MSHNVCILETSFIVKEGLRQIVSSLNDFRILGHFESFAGLENSSMLNRSNLLVCNPDLVKNDRTLAKLRIRNPELKVLVVDQERSSYKDYFTPASVDGYIFLCCDTEEVLKALLSVAKGEKFFCEKALDYMLAKKESLAGCNPINLSERELEILSLIVKGNSSKEISDLLYVSFHTVATHRKNICRKLKVSKVGELIAAAHKLGLVK